MNRTEHLLTCLSEECSEVIKEVSKAQRFSLDEKMNGHRYTNRERIVNEYVDLICVATILQAEGILVIPAVTNVMVSDKLHKIEHYMNISREYGVLDD